MMEHIPADNLDYALFRKISFVCATDEALVDMRQGSAVAVGYNETYQATVRSYIETNDGERKVWHSIGLVDKNEPTKFRFCKISADGQALYSDSQRSLMLREMSIQDSSDFKTVLFMIEQLDQVDWLPKERLGDAESKMFRFNL